MRDKDAHLMMEAYDVPDPNAADTDAEGKPIELGHIVQVTEAPGKQYVVVGFDSGLVDIAELGQSISVTPAAIVTIGELGE
jgi:hypothetical protein